MDREQDKLFANLEAEQAVLGQILSYRESMSQVADKLSASDFEFESFRHRDIYEVMHLLYEQNMGVDPTSVADYLERRGVTECKYGSMYGYLNHLWDAIYLGGDLATYTKTVLDRSSRRKQRDILQMWAQALATEEDAAVALAKAEAAIAAFSEARASDDLTPLSQVLLTYLNHLDADTRETGKLTGIPTGIDHLDTLLGGLQPQELYILGGRPGQGKSALVIHLVIHLLHHALYREQCNVAIFSLEMSHNDLASRLVSRETGINSQLLRSRLLDDEQWKDVIAATDRLSSEHVYIDESGDMSVSSMRTKARRMKRKHGLDLIIVDYLQLMKSDGEEGRRNYENETEKIARISRDLKKLAKALDVPVLALSALNRDLEKRQVKRPQLSDLRNAGEGDADAVFFVSQLEEEEGIALINVEKNRHGPLDDVYQQFDGATMTFKPTVYRPRQGA